MNTTTMDIPSNRVCDVRRYCRERLASIYDDGETEAIIFRLFEGILGWDKVQLLLHANDTINQSDLLRFYWAVKDLLRHRPIQYVVGYQWFCDCKIGVTEGVLIPRPETEEIVLRVIHDYQNTNRELRVLDLCTGSGCIAIALAKHLRCVKTIAIDLSEAALQQARLNAECNGVNVQFVKANVLDTSSLSSAAGGEFDIIVSNPPYVRRSERSAMQRNVLDYEPDEALFVDDNTPLLFYHSIAHYASTALSANGTLYLEINEALASDTLKAIESHHLKATLHQDFRLKDRLITAQRR